MSVGVLALTLATAGAARAAGDIVVSVSPTNVAIGQPLEVLIRAFVPVTRGTLRSRSTARSAPRSPSWSNSPIASSTKRGQLAIRTESM